MNLHSHYRDARRAIQTCVVGTGGFGRSFLAHARLMPLVDCRIAIDLDLDTALAGLAAAGIEPAATAACRTPAEAEAAWAAGHHIAAAALDTVLGLPFDQVIEATGHPEAGARHVAAAIAAGKDVALVSKEVDSVVGPILARRARAAGRLVTPVDGDQPSLLIGLVTWAEVLGLEIVAAGKASEYDFVFDPVSGIVTSNGTARPCPDLAGLWHAEGRPVADLVAARAAAIAAFPQRAVPDLCEMQIVANACGLAPDRPDFHAPLARVEEVAAFFATRADGGLLAGERRIDVFHCFRRPDEASFAGGVFVVVRTRDPASWRMLAEKGHVVSEATGTAMLYLPRHILGLEVATSLLDMAVHRQSGYGDDHRPRLDLVALASEDLEAGRHLVMGGHHHAIAGVEARLVEAGPLAADRPAPFYLAAGCRLVRAVRAGALIHAGDLALDETSALLALRREQDRVTDW